MCLLGPNFSDLPPLPKWERHVKKEPALPYNDLLMLFRRVSEDSGYKEALLRMALPALREHPEQATLVAAIEEILWLDESDDDDGYEVDLSP